jgi:hypothetical protein
MAAGFTHHRWSRRMVHRGHNSVLTGLTPAHRHVPRVPLSIKYRIVVVVQHVASNAAATCHVVRCMPPAMLSPDWPHLCTREQLRAASAVHSHQSSTCRLRDVRTAEPQAVRPTAIEPLSTRSTLRSGAHKSQFSTLVESDMTSVPTGMPIPGLIHPTGAESWSCMLGAGRTCPAAPQREAATCAVRHRTECG